MLETGWYIFVVRTHAHTHYVNQLYLMISVPVQTLNFTVQVQFIKIAAFCRSETPPIYSNRELNSFASGVGKYLWKRDGLCVVDIISARSRSKLYCTFKTCFYLITLHQNTYPKGLSSKLCSCFNPLKVLWRQKLFISTYCKNNSGKKPQESPKALFNKTFCKWMKAG